MWIAWAALALASPPQLLPGRFQSTVDTPFGPVDKNLAYHLCFSASTRIGTVVTSQSFLKHFEDPRGVVYSKQVHTQLTLETDAILRGDHSDTFHLVVEGGTWNGVHFPTPPGSPSTVVGNRYLVAFNKVNPPSMQLVPNTWPAGTALIQGALRLDPTADIDPALAKRALEASCAEIDFSAP